MLTFKIKTRIVGAESWQEAMALEMTGGKMPDDSVATTQKRFKPLSPMLLDNKADREVIHPDLLGLGGLSWEGLG